MALTAKEYGEIGRMTRDLYQHDKTPDARRVTKLANRLLGYNGDDTPAPEIPAGTWFDEISFDPKCLAGYARNRRARRRRFRAIVI